MIPKRALADYKPRRRRRSRIFTAVVVIEGAAVAVLSGWLIGTLLALDSQPVPVAVLVSGGILTVAAVTSAVVRQS